MEIIWVLMIASRGRCLSCLIRGRRWDCRHRVDVAVGK